ncbi:MAG TPA: 3-oxoacyl-[acyl-carrier-protein] synthase III C-terminal domain-containing protein [Pyrinomonadaceae bacterium]|nr:3-oxoacyl-[acyl-carrier-protein] synthase III C-terminal domain-containing protein [Pyrinomonadaceae bacterium]
MINLLATATSTPPHAFSTTELIASMMHKLSPELINTIGALGVDQRFSTLENFPEFLCGAPMRATSSSTELGVQAARRCIVEWGDDPRRVGLLIAGTNTPAQLLPCLASEVMADMHGVLSRSISTVSMQAQGCSVLLKTVEVARWYLTANPGKLALILLSEAHTPYITPVRGGEYLGYREIARLRRGGALGDREAERRRLDTTFMVQAMLFGDGAVALLLGREDGIAEFGPIAHLTNDDPGDVDLLAMGGGSLRPCAEGERPVYLMRPSVPNRGAHYAVETVRRVLEDPASPVSGVGDVSGCLIHTGSKKILDGVCAQLSIEPGSEKVQTSYEVLKTYGNLSSASTGFMLADRKGRREGPAIVVGFGVGFTASAGVVNFG